MIKERHPEQQQNKSEVENTTGKQYDLKRQNKQMIKERHPEQQQNKSEVENTTGKQRIKERHP
jgi:hypothetical protein